MCFLPRHLVISSGDLHIGSSRKSPTRWRSGRLLGQAQHPETVDVGLEWGKWSPFVPKPRCTKKPMPLGRCPLFFLPKKDDIYRAGERGWARGANKKWGVYTCRGMHVPKLANLKLLFEDHPFLRWASYMVDSPARFWIHWIFCATGRKWSTQILPNTSEFLLFHDEFLSQGIEGCVVHPTLDDYNPAWWNHETHSNKPNHTTYPNPNIAPSMKKTPSS